MFGLGRRHRDDEARRVQALSEELEQVHHTLLEATQRAETAECQAASLASQNRALAAKVHRLALQRVELLNDKDSVERQNKELEIRNLQLENESRVAKAAKADAWQVTNLKAALRQQAAQHEKKLATFKRRTKALLSAILPGGHNKNGAGFLAAPGSPASDTAEVAVDDLWDVPLILTSPSTPDVNSRIRSIVGCLYDDTITEDDALAQMTTLTASLLECPGLAIATSRGCSPLPVSRLGADSLGAAAEMVDAATDMQTVRARLVADVATETPAEVSYISTPCDASTAPSQGPASPRRMASAAVPVLDLAALVAQAMEEAPISGRSTASTSASNAGGPSFTSISQFVLAQPEKLQRLIMRHASATGAKAGQVCFAQARAPQSPYGTGLPISAAAVNAAGTNDLYTANGSTSLMDPFTQLSSGTSFSTRPSLTSRLLGLSSSNIANWTVTTSTVPPTATSAVQSSRAGAVSTSGVVVSPSKAAKRSGNTAQPRFAKRDAPEKGAKPLQTPAPMSMPGVKLLSSHDDKWSSNITFSGLSSPGQSDLDSDFKDLSLGSTALGFFQSSAGRR